MRNPPSNNPRPTHPGCQEGPTGVKCSGDDCSLRRRRIECSPRLCLGPCGNQRIQRKEFPNCLRIAARDGYGMCLVTTALIPKGNLVVEFVGLVMLGTPDLNQEYAYPFQGDFDGQGMYINCKEMGNESRFIQHSAQPNCEIQQWVVGEELRLIVAALEDIAVDDVLTLRYPQRSPSSGEKDASITEAEQTGRELDERGDHDGIVQR